MTDNNQQADSLSVREAVLALTEKHGNPNGTDYEQGVNDHGIRILGYLASLPAEGGEAVSDAVSLFETVCDYLLGEGPLRGQQFGDEPPTMKSGHLARYWWRSDLRQARDAILAALSAAPTPEGASETNAEIIARIGKAGLRPTGIGLRTLNDLMNAARAATPAPSPSEGPWQAWSGGDNPAPNQMVRVRLRDDTETEGLAETFNWRWFASSSDFEEDIVSFKLLSPPEGGVVGELVEAFNYVCGLLPGGAGAMEREADTYVLQCMVNVGELRRVRALRAALSRTEASRSGGEGR